jgi:transcriptional regulator with PAS, ATPase and Fis domain
MKQVMKLVKRVAMTSSTVLITGESGVGKELIARKIHSLSAREKQPFVSVNSGALPEGLLESELFGHEKGSFTGAISSRLGRFHIADRGTLFLDEIGNMSSAMQVKLLRVLQENEFSPVGSTEIVSVDVRLVTATNTDLERSVMEGEFREDLFYRLNVIEISVPPLRNRKQDIEPLVDYFLQAFSRKNSTEKKKITPEVMRNLLNYSWPGNVRELENTIERATVLSDGNTIILDDLPAKIISIPKGTTLPSLPEGNINLNTLIDNLERHYLSNALDRCNGVKSKAANYLGLKELILKKKI